MKIEIDTIYGQPSVSIVGMVDTAIKEAREREPKTPGGICEGRMNELAT